MSNILNLVLIEGRHDFPQTDGVVFSQSDIEKAVSFLNKGDTEMFIALLETMAFNKVFSICRSNGWTWTDPWWDGDDMIPEYLPKDLAINLYVTGFTPALLATINMSKRNGISLNTFNYNKDTGDYFLYPIA